jgi:formylglycine-generating enzyme required for sulfatase activity
MNIEMVKVPSGTFTMGDPEGDDEKPQHSVTVPSFLMGKYPITQAQWRFVAGLPAINRDLDPTPSHFKAITAR